MNRKIFMIALVAMMVAPLALVGCKGKVDKSQVPETSAVMPEAMTPAGDTLATTEPAQNIATETIPPSAAPQGLSTAQVPQQAVSQEKDSRAKDIQKALKNAGLYAGAIDGKLGPKTKKAIQEFQTSKGLKADGKVGPKTWAELEKYLVQQ